MADVPEPPREPNVDLDIELDLPNGARFRFRCNTGVAVVLGVTGVTLGVLFGKEALRPAVKGLFDVVFGACNLTEGSILVDVDCFTYKRAKDLLDDYLCGNLKRHFLEELRKMVGKVEDLKIRFEVEETLKLNKDRLRNVKGQEVQMKMSDTQEKSGLSQQEFTEIFDSIKKMKDTHKMFMDQLPELQDRPLFYHYHPGSERLEHFETTTYKPYNIPNYSLVEEPRSRVSSKIYTDSTSTLYDSKQPDYSFIEEFSSMSLKMSRSLPKHLPVSPRTSTINSRDEYGRTILHYTARFGPEKLSDCIRAGGDVNARDCDGRTALHLLCIPCNHIIPHLYNREIGKVDGSSAEMKNACEILAKRGADLDAKDTLHEKRSISM